MIANNNERKNNDTDWQPSFVALLPEIQKWLQLAFGHLDSEAREDAVEEGVVHTLLSYCHLYRQGRAARASASSLAWFATLKVKQGRPAVGRMNGKEPLSRYGRLAGGVLFERKNGEWIDMLADDKRASVSDQVAAAMDVRAWFATLTKRMKDIAKDLAFGFSTCEVAQKHGLTAGRISQLRRTFEKSWAAFQAEQVRADA